MIKHNPDELPEDYADYLKDLKGRIRATQKKAVLAANSQMILLYWQLGREILDRQNIQGPGDTYIDCLDEKLRQEFPNMKSFSTRNLRHMMAFAEAWPDRQFVQEVVAQLPWGHNLVLLNKLKEPEEREWYARACIEHGWSRNVLVHQIESGLMCRKAKSPSDSDGG